MCLHLNRTQIESPGLNMTEVRYMKLKTHDDRCEMRREKTINQHEFQKFLANAPCDSKTQLHEFWNNIVIGKCNATHIVHAYDGTDPEDRELFVKKDTAMYIFNYITCVSEMYNCLYDIDVIRRYYDGVMESLDAKRQNALASILTVGGKCTEVQVKDNGELNLYFVPKRPVEVRAVSHLLLEWLSNKTTNELENYVMSAEVLNSKIWAIGLSSTSFKVNLLVSGNHT